MTQLNRTKEKYEKAFGASERALDAYQKADADINLSRAEVEKQRVNSTIKSQQFEDTKNEYASQLQKTNEAQEKYYNHFNPQVLKNFQDLDERRIKCIQNFILKSVRVEQDVLPIIAQCLDGMTKCAENVDESEVCDQEFVLLLSSFFYCRNLLIVLQDSRLVVEKFKSGFCPPADIPFEDLSNNMDGRKDRGDIQSINGSMSSMVVGGQGPPHLSEKKSILDTITGGRVKKRSGLLGLFAASKVRLSPTYV